MRKTSVIMVLVLAGLLVAIGLVGCKKARAPTPTPAPAAATPTRTVAIPTPVVATPTPMGTPARAPGDVLGEVLARAAGITALKYDMIVSAPGQPTTQTGKVWAKGQNTRMETTQQGQTMVIITNMDKGVIYTYLPAQKTATKMEIPRGPEGQRVLSYAGVSLVQLAALFAAMGPAVVGTETLDGKESLVFEVKSGAQTTKFWVWKQYGLPIRQEMSSPGGTVIMEYKNIDFGNIPDSMFELPAGVRVQ